MQLLFVDTALNLDRLSLGRSTFLLTKEWNEYCKLYSNFRKGYSNIRIDIIV